MFSAAQGDNGLHDLRRDTSMAQVDNLHNNADLLGPRLLGETDQQSTGSPTQNRRASLSGQHETAPTMDWGYAAAAAAATAGTLPQKEVRLANFEPPSRQTLLRSEHLEWECSALRGQLEAALVRATAAEDRARAAEELTHAAEDRAGLAEESARAMEERARVAEAAVVRLTEEVDQIRADAAAQPMLPLMGEVQAGIGLEPGSPPDFMAMYGTSWQPLQCQQRLLAAMYKSFAASYRAAKEALQPGNNMLHVEEELGRGGFGGVHKALCTATGDMWAIKKPVTETDKKVLIYEMLVYRSLPAHRNILRVFSMYDCLLCPALALECGKCDFNRALANGLMPFSEELECMADVAEGTGHCHENGVVICDLKPSNVILVHDGTRYVGKVADFGLACGIGQTRGARCGTPGYFPPEVAHSSTLAEPSTDAVSVGAILAIVALQAAHREANVFGHKMFRTSEERSELENLAQTDHDGFRDKLAAIGLRTMQLPDYGFAKKVTRPSLLNKMPGSSMMALRKLIRTTTSANPAERPAMLEVAPEIRAVASAVRVMTEAAGRSASAATPESIDDPTTSNIANNNSNSNSNSDDDDEADIGSGSSDGFSPVGSAEGMILPPHLLSFDGSGGGITGSSTGGDTVSSLGIGLPENDEPGSTDAGAGDISPDVSLSRGMEFDDDNGGGSAAPPLFETADAGGARAGGVGADGSGSRPRTPADPEAVGVAGASTNELFPAVEVVGDGGVEAVGGTGGGASTAPILAEHPVLGAERRGGEFVAAYISSGSFESNEGLEVASAGRKAEGIEAGQEEEEVPWDWGWEWQGVGGDSGAVGFGL